MAIMKNLLIALLFILVSCGQPKEEQYYHDGTLKVSAPLLDDKWNGLVKFYYESGQLDIEQMWKDGVEDGFSRKYFETGELKQVDTFCLGSPCGSSIEYFIDGQTKSVGHYENGLPVGAHTFFFESGDTLEVDYYNIEGKIYDFEKYGEDGEIIPDSKVGFFFMDHDTVKRGETVTLTAYMGNNQSRTRLIIGSEFIRDELLKDTIGYYFPEKGVDDGIKYQYTTDQIGIFEVNGIIQDRVNEGEYVRIRSIPFSYGFVVTE